MKDVREVIEQAGGGGLFQRSAILFIDEIHRFSKAQQDSLLGAVEKGTITLIGATTENPSFEVIGALLSRCQVYMLEAAHRGGPAGAPSAGHARGCEDPRTRRIDLKEINCADARERRRCPAAAEHLRALRASRRRRTWCVITDALVKEVVQSNAARYDKQGEQHYDIISAFIKSMRGSDPNAAVYWLARMVEGGEDPLFIARRHGDPGQRGHRQLANPNALLMATTAMQAAQMIGWPESRIILSECAIYLACSPKSNSALHGHRRRPGRGGAERRSARTAAPAQCTHQADEGPAAMVRTTSTATKARDISMIRNSCRKRSAARPCTSRVTTAGNRNSPS